MSNQHQSLSHAFCHPKFLPPPPNADVATPAGHPKLLQLETPLILTYIRGVVIYLDAADA